MNGDELYVGREQTKVKHFILRKYLERFAHIVGSYCDALTYVDCFSGPWNARSEEFKDSSFAIAVDELRKAKETLKQRGRNVNLRCFFLEKNRNSYAALERFAGSVKDAEIKTRNAALENSISEILAFVKEGGKNSFPFIFIDPTGWTGFEMRTIAPLLQLNPGEVLINFMTSHVRRFLDSPQEETQDSFTRLFGSSSFKEKVLGLSHMEREDAAISEYTRNAAKTGKFSFAGTAIVLHPELDRTHFHLIYLTRSPKGLEVFKEAEKHAMAVQESTRAEAQQRKRINRGGQTELFGSAELHDSSHYDSLRDRYLEGAKAAVRSLLQSQHRILYDDAWKVTLSRPMAWESDLKTWISEWCQSGLLQVDGMEARQRVPRRESENYLVWLGSVTN